MKNSTPTPISDAEWILMESLWDHAPQTASSVARKVRDATGWADNTVRTLLTRLTEKGVLLTGEDDAGVRVYRPAHPRAAYVQRESQSFLNRVFRGAAKPLLAHFVHDAQLSPAEVDELKKLLDASVKPPSQS